MIDRSYGLSISHRAQVLGVCDQHMPGPATAANLAIMRRIDELRLQFPVADSGMLSDLLW